MKLYTDGGVIRKNPSAIGGTWAWALVNNQDKLIAYDCGYVTPESLGVEAVTNNQTELLAVIKSFGSLNVDMVVELCSDSEITLGRVFKNYAFNNIPELMKSMLKDYKKNRLIYFDDFTYTLMDGHPTKEQVERGIGKKGHVTSKWNVWCDKKCGEMAELALSELGVSS